MILAASLSGFETYFLPFFCLHAIDFQKIFYSKSFTEAKANPEARDLAVSDPDAYRKKVDACVRESQKQVYINETGCTTRFTEEAVCHRVLRDLLKHHIRNENQVTKQAVLAQIDKARKV